MASKDSNKNTKNVLDDYQDYIQFQIHRKCDNSCTLKNKNRYLIQDIKLPAKKEINNGK